MSTIEDTYESQQVAKAMIRYGGGFVSHLGEALTRSGVLGEVPGDVGGRLNGQILR